MYSVGKRVKNGRGRGAKLPIIPGRGGNRGHPEGSGPKGKEKTAFGAEKSRNAK